MLAEDVVRRYPILKRLAEASNLERYRYFVSTQEVTNLTLANRPHGIAFIRAISKSTRDWVAITNTFVSDNYRDLYVDDVIWELGGSATPNNHDMLTSYYQFIERTFVDGFPPFNGVFFASVVEHNDDDTAVDIIKGLAYYNLVPDKLYFPYYLWRTHRTNLIHRYCPKKTPLITKALEAYYTGRITDVEEPLLIWALVEGKRYTSIQNVLNKLSDDVLTQVLKLYYILLRDDIYYWLPLVDHDNQYIMATIVSTGDIRILDAYLPYVNSVQLLKDICSELGFNDFSRLLNAGN
jgi:hypothetical protein